MSALPARSTLSFTERYDEMHALGLADWQIAKRMAISLLSLERMLERNGRPISPLLREMTDEMRPRSGRLVS